MIDDRQKNGEVYDVVDMEKVKGKKEGMDQTVVLPSDNHLAVGLGDTERP